MKVKVCGITQVEQVTSLVQLNINFIGFIFYPNSKRYLLQQIDFDFEHVIPVGVFVNASINEIKKELQKIPNIKTLQLHGNESPEFCAMLKKEFTIIKAFAIDNAVININQLVAPYVNHCSYFLFDTKTPDYGGSGKHFNWELLHNYNLETPFILSGGISKADVTKIKTFNHEKLYAIDINSQFEIKHGVKDISQIKFFINKI
jgi:phosphoribosylanthranilate isomerase